ncbi:hypothetical protein RUMCAL_02331 [Ruminococcus callidus ATCC 27760]|uniref:Uncharacterized protein n=1 Tax=Ruminococcus callidus ATCC 27760 TaxID=411473 RepID=U2KLT7_9FIRM|nr:hypothetical protein RUMCAL_02331 [Ruminococcus callidus ATCC 27760]
MKEKSGDKSHKLCKQASNLHKMHIFINLILCIPTKVEKALDNRPESW